jgi:hypothetical protein
VGITAEWLFFGEKTGHPVGWMRTRKHLRPNERRPEVPQVLRVRRRRRKSGIWDENQPRQRRSQL